MINPNLHPIFVHFTVALFSISTVLFLAAHFLNSETRPKGLLSAARWNLWLGAGITLATIAAGYDAYNTVAHDTPSHLAMTDHKNWAFGTGAIFLAIAYWSVRLRRQDKPEPTSFLLVLVVATSILGLTAWKGGELVYRHGLGVMSLPQAEEGAAGHEHAPGQGHGDTPAADESQPHEHGDGEGHGDTPAADESQPHEHGDGEGHDEAAAAATPMAEEGAHEHPNAVMIDPALVADQFHAALEAGDGDAVGQLLAGDVVILEGDHAQTSRDEYMSGHMNSDMAYLPYVTRTVLDRQVSQSGNLAWVVTSSRTVGEYNGRTIDSTGREMMVMEHNGHDWQITLIHWSEG
jgi:uncharacterized membrane protein/ketosteroid isomerase-like protein